MLHILFKHIKIQNDWLEEMWLKLILNQNRHNFKYETVKRNNYMCVKYCTLLSRIIYQFSWTKTWEPQFVRITKNHMKLRLYAIENCKSQSHRCNFNVTSHQKGRSSVRNPTSNRKCTHYEGFKPDILINEFNLSLSCHFLLTKMSYLRDGVKDVVLLQNGNHA